MLYKKPFGRLEDSSGSTFGPEGAASPAQQKQSKAINADEFADYLCHPFVLYC